MMMNIAQKWAAIRQICPLAAVRRFNVDSAFPYSVTDFDVTTSVDDETRVYRHIINYGATPDETITNLWMSIVDNLPPDGYLIKAGIKFRWDGQGWSTSLTTGMTIEQKWAAIKELDPTASVTSHDLVTYHVHMPNILIGGDGLLSSLGNSGSTPQKAVYDAWDEIEVRLPAHKYLTKDNGAYRWFEGRWIERLER